MYDINLPLDMEKKIKLSEKQKEVIRLMREGENLVGSNYSGCFYIIKNEMTQPVNKKTALFLINGNLIVGKQNLHDSTYSLTPLGQTIEI